MQCKITGEFKGLIPGEHGLHIHEFGDLSGGVKTAGDPYNPFNKDHGGPGLESRQMGDMGNVTVGKDGSANFEYYDDTITLFGDFTIVGRACIIKRDADNLGRGDYGLGEEIQFYRKMFPLEPNTKTGSSGPALACGIIGHCP